VLCRNPFEFFGSITDRKTEGRLIDRLDFGVALDVNSAG
jgi:hypothetical protein